MSLKQNVKTSVSGDKTGASLKSNPTFDSLRKISVSNQSDKHHMSTIYTGGTTSLKKFRTIANPLENNQRGSKVVMKAGANSGWVSTSNFADDQITNTQTNI